MGKGALFNIAPTTETVTLQGVAVTVKGLSLADLVSLINRFPEMRALLAGGDNLTPTAVLAVAPMAACAAIAYATGSPSDPEAEAIAESLAFGDQLKLFEPILRLTLGEDGPVPLAARLNAALASIGGGTVSRAGTSPKQSKS